LLRKQNGILFKLIKTRSSYVIHQSIHLSMDGWMDGWIGVTFGFEKVNVTMTIGISLKI